MEKKYDAFDLEVAFSVGVLIGLLIMIVAILITMPNMPT